MSPTTVYSSRSSEPSSAAATSPGREPDAEPERRQAAARPALVRARAWRVVHRDRGRARRGRRGRPAATGAPNTAITASPTNCITVPSSSRIARFIAARCALSCARAPSGRRARRWPSSRGCRTSAPSPPAPRSRRCCRPSLRSFSARPPGRSRLSVSPCSSRSTIAWCSMRSRRSEPPAPALAPCASFRNRCSTASAIAAGVVLRGAAIALIGRPSATFCRSPSSSAVSSPRPVTGVHQRLDDLGIEHRPAGRDLADGARELVALGDAVLEQVRVARGAVGEQRDRVLGLVVLRQDDHAGAGMALAHLLGGVDALALEVRAASGCR